MRCSPKYRFLGWGVLLLASATICACGGGGGGGAAGPNPLPTATAMPMSGIVPASTVALPTIGVSGISVSGSLGAAIAASLTESISVSAPSGVATLLAQRLNATAYRSDTSTLSPVAYVEFSSSTNATLNAIPGFTFTLPQIISGDSYYLAFYNYVAPGWVYPVDGPATVNGSTVTFASVGYPIAITPTHPAIFALYAAPTPSGAPTPASTPVASPNALALYVSNPAVAATFTVTEPNDTAEFTSSISCTENPLNQSPASSPFVAEVSPQYAAPDSLGAAVTFTVTPGAETGSCTVTVTDANSAKATVSVTVSSTNLSVYGAHRK